MARQRGIRWLAGRATLIVSGLGFPLTQAVILRFGRAGALVAEAVSGLLFVRDLAMVAGGAPKRLRTFPALLLRIELAAGAVAVVTGLTAILRPRQAVERSAAGAVEAVRRGAVGTLFGMHTYRFWIYLQPGQGRRETPEATET